MTAAELAAWLTPLGDVIGVFEPTDDGPDFYCIVETGT